MFGLPKEIPFFNVTLSWVFATTKPNYVTRVGILHSSIIAHKKGLQLTMFSYESRQCSILSNRTAMLCSIADKASSSLSIICGNFTKKNFHWSLQTNENSCFGSHPNFAQAKYRSLVFLRSPTPRFQTLATQAMSCALLTEIVVL